MKKIFLAISIIFGFTIISDAFADTTFTATYHVGDTVSFRGSDQMCTGEPPCYWTFGGDIPPGLSLETNPNLYESGGTFYGTLTTAGTYVFAVQADDQFSPPYAGRTDYYITVLPLVVPEIPTANASSLVDVVNNTASGATATAGAVAEGPTGAIVYTIMGIQLLITVIGTLYVLKRKK